MKKIFVVLILCLVVVVALCGLSACEDEKDEGGYSVVCTVFPAYDWARNVVAGGDVRLTLLLDSGADLHNYIPTTRDMLAISKCDLFVYVGGESDEWVGRVLTAYPSEKRVALNLMEALGDRAREEEELEGAEDVNEHEHDEEEMEYDEHIWLSLKNAAVCVNAIKDKIAAIDAENADKYAENAASYVAALDALDAKYAAAVAAANVKTLVFCDRFPFLYLMKDYGLTYYAAFSGCSTETNASPATIKFLADKVVENDLKCVIVLEGQDRKIAQAVVRETKTNREILALDSLQSAGQTEAENGTTYLSVMEKNLDVIKYVVR